MCQCFQMARKFLRWLQSHPPRLPLVHPLHLCSVSSMGKGGEERIPFGICLRAGSLHPSTFPPKKCRKRAGGSTCPALEKGFQTGQVATGLGKASPSSTTSPKYPPLSVAEAHAITPAVTKDPDGCDGGGQGCSQAGEWGLSCVWLSKHEHEAEENGETEAVLQVQHHCSPQPGCDGAFPSSLQRCPAPQCHHIPVVSS